MHKIVNKPSNTVSQTMIYFQNKHLYQKELMLIEELDNLEKQERDLKGRKNAINLLNSVNLFNSE
jgi:hypothetical protein